MISKLFVLSARVCLIAGVALGIWVGLWAGLAVGLVAFTLLAITGMILQLFAFVNNKLEARLQVQ